MSEILRREGSINSAIMQGVTADGIVIDALITDDGVVQTQSIQGKASELNNSITPLLAGATFTGVGEAVWQYPSVVVACKTDQNGTLYIEFSPDNTNWDSSLSFSVSAGTNEVHRIVVTRPYARVRFTNTSASNQTYFRITTLFGSQTALTSSLNSVIQADADAAAVRPLDFNLMVAEGLYQNRNNTIKDGFNIDIDTGSVPEDVTNEGGVYAGFPTGAVEAGQIVVAGADTGTVYYSYLASATSTDYVFGSKAVAGAGTYALGHNIWRCNFAYFVSNSPTTTNVSDITIRNTVTTTNVFCVIPTGYGQSYCAAYTVPFGSAVYIDRITGGLRGSSTGSLDGFFWYRESGGGGFRLRFPFELQYGGIYFDDVDYLIRIPSGVDFIPRIVTASANNLSAKLSYRLIKVTP
jgi:hypothetical protein